ncbi:MULTISPECIES: hypothetical protein [unclassified Paenibacillus]|uniref:hypothetical protein n=1 Tax=unclassified Paenibacillus TaxID=185978 RepID=UPI003636DA80
MRHCVHCDRPVRPVKKASWLVVVVNVLIAIFFPLVGVPLLIGYAGYYVFFKKRECPICAGRDFTLTQEQEDEREFLESVSMRNMFKRK